MTRDGLRRKRPFEPLSKKQGLKKRASKNKAYVAIVLDRSSSMNSIRRETIDMFNEQVDAIKSSETPTIVSLVTFSSVVDDCEILHEKARFLRKLNYNNYRPCGMTALYDAIGMTLNEFLDHHDFGKNDASFLVVVITDGQENASTQYDHDQIQNMIEEFEDSECGTVTFLGANINVRQFVDDFGIKIGNAGVFTANAAGVRNASRSLRYATSQYLDNVGAGELKSSCFYAGTSVGLDNQNDTVCETDVNKCDDLETNKK